MALTNPRPLHIPALQNELLHNTASPVFQASSLVFSPKNEDMARADALGTFPNTPLSEGSPSDIGKNKKDGSISTPKKESLTLEISKIIPVTGERPMPKERTAPLDDNVLYAVFVILWEEDPELQGMTVKQLSDHLLEKHPEMSNLSTKLSNLISAKLNAYVKKLEKGEKTLTYALSREWSNSSPRRMVYVYRGILSPDYKKHAQAAAVQLRQQQSAMTRDNSFADLTGDSKKNGALPDAASNNGKHMVNNTNVGFSLSPEFNIPYSTSPVSAILTPTSTNSDKDAGTDDISARKRTHLEEDDSNIDFEHSKRSKSNSAIHNENKTQTDSSRTESGPTVTYITAAAAAPRLSKFSSKNNFKGSSQNSAGIVAAIHKVISTQTPIDSCSRGIQAKTTVTASLSSEPPSSSFVDSWVKTVREGFLADDIESPEAISLEELEYIFD